MDKFEEIHISTGIVGHVNTPLSMKDRTTRQDQQGHRGPELTVTQLGQTDTHRTLTYKQQNGPPSRGPEEHLPG